MFRPPREAELLSESKELNVNFQDLESFLADPDPHDLMAIRPRHPNKWSFWSLHPLGLRAPCVCIGVPVTKPRWDMFETHVLGRY